MNSTELVRVVDPRDGTVLDDLAEQPTRALAPLAVELKRREQLFKGMRELVEAELTERVRKAGRRIMAAGDYELTVEAARQRAWDGDELELVLRELVDRGVLTAGELPDGLISRAPRVDGRAALRLLGMLIGSAKARVEECFTWETKGRPRLLITPSVALARVCPDCSGKGYTVQAGPGGMYAHNPCERCHGHGQLAGGEEER